MTLDERKTLKAEFRKQLVKFVDNLLTHVATDDAQWTIKGFVDVFRNIYTISADTKIVSKILEIHIFPKILQFASEHNYQIVLTDHQNYYPDLSFVNVADDRVKFAVDFKTTYRRPDSFEHCNGFTLGSHGEYFINRSSRKNIQFPYNEYLGHFCLGIIYTRTVSEDVDETRIFAIDHLRSIVSVIRDFQFFVSEKWEIASDRSGSGNTANIGSIDNIQDILAGNGVFKALGEEIFDDYWMNYGKISILDETGKERKIRNLKEFLTYKGIDPALINARKRRLRNKV